MTPRFRIYDILRPLGWLYGAAAALRNRRFDSGRAASAVYPIPVISVGNITAGGTGKTPHTEYIASLLQNRITTAILSRGFGRSTKGYILADESATSRTIGDEPMQMHRRFPHVILAVCEKRAQGIEQLIRTCNPQVILLDDAYQHRAVKPSLNILLVNYNRNILHDAMLPAGRLRESAAERKRADIMIVTKCPQDLSASQMDQLASALAVTPAQQVFFTAIEYGTLYPMAGAAAAPSPSSPALAVTGIAGPEPLVAQLRKEHRSVTLQSYPDHHRYSERDIRSITSAISQLGPHAIAVTTEKDAARLHDMHLPSHLSSRLYIMPVKPVFLRDKEQFDNTILNHIETFKQ